MSCYITALIAGPYVSITDSLTSSDGRTIDLGLYSRKSLSEFVDADEMFEVTKQGFEFFESQFGVPYPFEKYDQLFVPQFNAGAMENAGAVTFVEQYIFRSKPSQARVERRAITVLHELAHMWFGDLVTMRWWNDLWLNESFAEYMSTLACAQNTKYTNAWTTFVAGEKSWGYEQDQLPTTHPIKAEIRDLEDVLVNFDGITYAKGASVLKQLVAWVGQEEFMAGLNAYFGKHAWANTELSDLMVELEAASGRDLTDWTERWLETAGVNTLIPHVEADQDGVITSFVIEQIGQEGHPTLRPHRLAVGFYDHDDAANSLVRTHRVELDVDGERTEVPELVGRERPDLVLLNDDDLAYAKIRLDECSQDTANNHLGDFEESLPRSLVWGAAWDSVHDGVSPAREYVQLVLANIGRETDSTAVQVQLRQLDTVLDYYLAPKDADEIRAAAAATIWDLVEASAPGSDHQWQFFRAFARRAVTAAQFDQLEAFDRDENIPSGVDMNTDTRWVVLTALVAAVAAARPRSTPPWLRTTPRPAPLPRPPRAPRSPHPRPRPPRGSRSWWTVRFPTRNNKRPLRGSSVCMIRNSWLRTRISILMQSPTCGPPARTSCPSRSRRACSRAWPRRQPSTTLSDSSIRWPVSTTACAASSWNVRTPSAAPWRPRPWTPSQQDRRTPPHEHTRTTSPEPPGRPPEVAARSPWAL